MCFVGVFKVFQQVIAMCWKQEIHLGPSTGVGESMWTGMGQQRIEKQPGEDVGWNTDCCSVVKRQWIHKPEMGRPRPNTSCKTLLSLLTCKMMGYFKRSICCHISEFFLIEFWKLHSKSMAGPITFITLCYPVKNKFLMVSLAPPFFSDDVLRTRKFNNLSNIIQFLSGRIRPKSK